MKTVQITIRVSPEIADSLRVMSQQTDRSVSWLLNHAAETMVRQAGFSTTLDKAEPSGRKRSQ